MPLLKYLGGLKSLLRKPTRNAVQDRALAAVRRSDLTTEPSLFSQVYDEVCSVSFRQAEDIVMPFGKLMEDKQLKQCQLTAVGRVIDSGFYSRANLTCSRSKTLRAFKAFYIMVNHDQAAWAAKYALQTRVAYTLPDEQTEPIQFEDLDRLYASRKQLEEALNVELPILEYLRSNVQKHLLLHSQQIVAS